MGHIELEDLFVTFISIKTCSTNFIAFSKKSKMELTERCLLLLHGKGVVYPNATYC